jgi:PAS domain S-box-containing protein
MKIIFGIRLKSIIAITILVIGVAAILGLFFINHEKKIIHSNLERIGVVLASNLAYNAEYGVLTSSPSLLSNLLEGVTKQPQVSYCIIQDLTGKVLVSKGLNKDLLTSLSKLNAAANKANEPLIQYVRTDEGKEYYEVSIPIMSKTVETPKGEGSLFESEEDFSNDFQQQGAIETTTTINKQKEVKDKIGIVRVGLSLAAASSLERKSQQVTIAITLTIVLIAGMITTVLTGFAVKPIQKLVEGTRRIAKGELNFKVTGFRSDEIGQLAESFNKMMDDLGRSRDELVKAKEYTDNIIRSMVDMLIVLDPDGRIRTINPATVKILGFKENEIIGKPIDVIFSEEGNFQGALNWMVKRLTQEGFVADYETNCKTKEGNTIPVILSGAVMRNKNGDVEGVVGIAKDITDRKRTQGLIEQKSKKLEEVNQSLVENERKLKNMLSDLKKAHEDLQDAQLQLFQSEKLKVVGKLASGVAHEVKNPLAIILQGVEYLARKVPKDNPTITEVIQDVTNAVHRADSVIKGVLDYSSLQDLKMESIDINTVIDVTLLLVRHEFTQSHIQVERLIGKHLPRVKIDKNKMEQVFVNLILNSVQAMSKGGKLTIKIDSRQVQDADLQNHQMEEENLELGLSVVIVDIEDSGTGIPREVLPKIFDPFFTTKGGKGGTGLGLSIVKNIVNLHRGKLIIENMTQGGVRSRVMLRV